MKVFDTITKHYRVALFLIVFLAAFLRFYRLDSVPPSMYWDEVSQGYNSYSILKTGRDEHAELFPLARFAAFGDYKAPVYIYADVPFIAILGKNTLAVRFPSALFGTLTVLAAFFLVLELFSSSKNKILPGLLAAFFLSISPWHIQLSRAAYEANIATFFTVAGVFLFLRSIRTKSWMFVLSAVSFVLAFYAFNSHRVFIPLFVLFLFALFRKELWTMKKYVIVAGIISFIVFIPFLQYLKTPESKLRFNEVNIFSNADIVKQSNQWIAEDSNSAAGKVLHNRRVLFGLLYAKHYFDFFDPKYLFFTGDGNPRFSLQDNGELYLWELPLLLAGVYLLCRKRNREALLIFGWFLLAPVAAATARETPHALRSETFIPTYEIIMASGMVGILGGVRRFGGKVKYLAFVGFGIIGIVSFYIFVHDYFVHYGVIYSYQWQYGYEQAVQKVEKIKSGYDEVVFTTAYGRPYIYVLFYGNTAPNQYWKDSTVTRDVFGFYTVSKLGKYVFRDHMLDSSDKGKKVLYVGAPNEIPSNFKKIDEVKFLDGGGAFVIAQNT
ncbi:MAG TPA: phospholipid carrier-dependent glycosyltransferase [Candidatus Saccharimonadales bacterium]|nr:phospholipid carrier-dependent glycosyltransferase [Candidatus Saccharimonadales bacterium]